MSSFDLPSPKVEVIVIRWRVERTSLDRFCRQQGVVQGRCAVCSGGGRVFGADSLSPEIKPRDGIDGCRRMCSFVQGEKDSDSAVT